LGDGKSAKIAVITGAAQGIGQRTADVFAERGYRLALADLRGPDAALKARRERGDCHKRSYLSWMNQEARDQRNHQRDVPPSKSQKIQYSNEAITTNTRQANGKEMRIGPFRTQPNSQ